MIASLPNLLPFGSDFRLFQSGLGRHARSDFERGPYTGRMQAWHNCEVDAAATFLTLSAAPEGRECVVLMQLAMYGEANVEVGQHILDAFEVECAAAATYPLAAPDAQQYAHGEEATPQPAEASLIAQGCRFFSQDEWTNATAEEKEYIQACDQQLRDAASYPPP